MLKKHNHSGSGNSSPQRIEGNHLGRARSINHPVGLFYRKPVNTGLKILRDNAFGSLVSILSLIVTIILTVYIFSYTRTQEIANIGIFMTFSQIDTNSYNVFVEVNNNGPSVANDVFVQVYDNNMNCTFSSSSYSVKGDGVPYIDPSQLDISNYGVFARYEKILQNQTGQLFFNVRISPKINDQVVKFGELKYWTLEDERKGYDFINRNVFHIETSGGNIKIRDTYFVIIRL